MNSGIKKVGNILHKEHDEFIMFLMQEEKILKMNTRYSV